MVCGPRSTGKSSITKAYVQAIGLLHAIIDCRECVTERHLLERTLRAATEATRPNVTEDDVRASTDRCENVSALTVHLLRLLEAQRRLVLVLDGIDEQREASPSLLPALARLGEVIPGLSVVLIAI